MCCIQSLELFIVYLSHEKATVSMTSHHLKVTYSEIIALPSEHFVKAASRVMFFLLHIRFVKIFLAGSINYANIMFESNTGVLLSSLQYGVTPP
jgi:hypothetical protein